MSIPDDQYAFFRSFFQRTPIYRLLFCCLVALWLLVAFRPDPVPLALASIGSFVPATGVLTRFVDQQGTPLSLVTIRLLCYDDSQNPPALTADLLIKTAQHGKTLLPLPATCLKVAALQQVHQQPSGKAGRSTAYTVYNTSWQPGTSTLVPIDGDIVLRSDWRLVLFDVAAALEWEPAPGDAYVATLNQGLRLASAYLYDLTDGQMAFGPLTITTGGVGWDSADIRIRAANNYRPSAQVGGIVAVTTPYISSIGVQTVYRPGAILMGRYWDGISAANSITGAATEPAAYRTLVHEWLHYALFLYDEYQDNQATGRVEHFCTCADLPFVGSSPSACGGISPNLAGSAMSYHYTASELWHASANASCQKTDQQAVQVVQRQ